MSARLLLKLEEIDPDTGCIMRVWRIGDISITQLNELLDDDFSEIGHTTYDLDADDIRKISATFLMNELSFEMGQLSRVHAFLDALPYPIHTGRELAMMLTGKKPFARFVLGDGEDFDTIIRQPFTRHVEAGTLRAFVDREEGPNGATTVYSFTLPGEEWRVLAMAELWQDMRKNGWSDSHERREGELLGYENWQNDAFLALRDKLIKRASD